MIKQIFLSFKQALAYRVYTIPSIPLIAPRCTIEDSFNFNTNLPSIGQFKDKIISLNLHPLKRNSMLGRAYSVQCPANNPIEDRFDCRDIVTKQGFFTAVFDGHGGYKVAEFASELMAVYFNEVFSYVKGTKKERIVEALRQAFDLVESDFLEEARKAMTEGENLARTGSCVLAAVVSDNMVISANVGDCRGLILTQGELGMSYRKINNKLNASSKKEQVRLRNQFPHEKDIVVCRARNPRACYVKNRLQPTRAIGDFELKHEQFAMDSLAKDGKKFNGPYITHLPEIMSFQLEPKDKFLVMASDGLWDELSKQEVADIVFDNRANKHLIANFLLDAAFNKAAKKAGMSEQDLKEVPVGKRRDLHDDITILLIDLQGQFS